MTTREDALRLATAYADVEHAKIIRRKLRKAGEDAIGYDRDLFIVIPAYDVAEVRVRIAEERYKALVEEVARKAP